MKRLLYPGQLVTGEDALSVLGTLQGKKAVITTGSSSMKKQGFLDQVTELLEGAGMEVAVFSGIESDPTVQTVAKGAKFLQDEEPDWLIALGGGTIDAAKPCGCSTKIEAKYETLRPTSRYCVKPLCGDSLHFRHGQRSHLFCRHYQPRKAY